MNLYQHELKTITSYMSTPNKITPNLGLVIGVLGFLAGVGLLFSDSWFIGLFGAIASAGVAYQGYNSSQQQ